jgi:HSP20 family molecular chaperone IbpA
MIINNVPLDIPPLWQFGSTVTNKPIDQAYLSKLLDEDSDLNSEIFFQNDFYNNSFVFFVDLPGCKKENINIELDLSSNKIRISSFRTLFMSSVKINKTLMIPKDGDTGKLKATLADGVLTLRIPKTPPQTAKFTKITID